MLKRHLRRGNAWPAGQKDIRSETRICVGREPNLMSKCFFLSSQLCRERGPVSQGLPHPLLVLVYRCLLPVKGFAVNVLFSQPNLPSQCHTVVICALRCPFPVLGNRMVLLLWSACVETTQAVDGWSCRLSYGLFFLTVPSVFGDP